MRDKKMSLGANPLAAIARSKRIATKLSKQLPLEELEKAIDHLKSALEVSKQRERDKAQTRQKAVVEKVSALLEEAGLTPSDLQGKRIKNKTGASKRKPSAKKTGPKKGTKIAPKYQLKVKGEIHRWTGRGRMPLVFKAYVEKGGSLDKCLI
jgi:DNA-binding protein H-NS